MYYFIFSLPFLFSCVLCTIGCLHKWWWWISGERCWTALKRKPLSPSPNWLLFFFCGPGSFYHWWTRITLAVYQRLRWRWFFGWRCMANTIRVALWTGNWARRVEDEQQLYSAACVVGWGSRFCLAPADHGGRQKFLFLRRQRQPTKRWNKERSRERERVV